MRFSVKTLGCKVNQYESEKIQTELEAAGFECSHTWAGLDIIIINTCAVTHIAERKSRQFIRKAIKTNPSATVFITGCAAKTDLERLEEILPTDFIYYEKGTVVNRIIDLYSGHIDIHQEVKTTKNAQSKHTRAYLLIQNGCENYCSYCIIPHIRGNSVSRPLVELKQELLTLSRNNIKEIVLTGINLGMYSHEESTLLDVCKAVITLTEARLRLSSIEPNLIPFELIEYMASEPRFCRHLHIPLQSGSDAVLHTMNRKYTTYDYKRLLQYIREFLPDISITTDLIIGFPTESEENFEETCEFVKRCNFAKIHVFPYSARKGTPAASMPSTVSDTQLEKRLHTVLELEQSMREGYISSHIGKELDILLEQEKDGYYWGYSSNYLRTRVPKTSGHLNTIITINAVSAENENLIGETQAGMHQELP